VAVVVLGGAYDLASASELGHTLAELLERARHVVVDMSAATFVDSYTMGTIIQAKREADSAGSRFNVVLGSDSVVAKRFEIAQVLPMLNRVETLDEALTGL
jgi:anti-anti-sigma factor